MVEIASLTPLLFALASRIVDLVAVVAVDHAPYMVKWHGAAVWSGGKAIELDRLLHDLNGLCVPPLLATSTEVAERPKCLLRALK